MRKKVLKRLRRKSTAQHVEELLGELDIALPLDARAAELASIFERLVPTERKLLLDVIHSALEQRERAAYNRGFDAAVVAVEAAGGDLS